MATTLPNDPKTAGATYDPRVYEEPTDSKGRFFGAGLFITEIGCMIAYGLAGSYFVEPNPDDATYNQVFSVVLLGLFVLVGFGMVLSFYRFGSWLGMATAIIVVAVSVQLAPLIQKFWFSVFITSFGNMNDPTTVGTNIQ
jgi:ABC-type transport system involved in multi-copper enzyme maturation permease subunit